MVRVVETSHGVTPPRVTGNTTSTAGGEVAFKVRDGDTLVVAWPEVAIQIAPFNTVHVGGLIYTRQLRAGDDLDLEYARIYAFLRRKGEAEAREKCAHFVAELRQARGI